jgi:hypothetical protein
MHPYSSQTVNDKRQTSIRVKLILFSTIFFGLLLLVCSVTFFFLMEKNLIQYTGNKLSREIMYEQIRLEAAVNSEIAIATAMASSPMIKRYFSRPSERNFHRAAIRELEAFQQSFTSKIIFWVNDRDLIFHMSGSEPYVVDPDDPVNYWYYLTLYETELYNVNINYNPDLEKMNLWINAPVKDDDGNPIGMLGGAIILTDFIDTFYSGFPEDAKLYMFNSAGEITGSRDLVNIENKIRIDEKLGKLGHTIFSRVKSSQFDSVDFFEIDSAKGVVVVGYVPILDWYVVSVYNFTFSDYLHNGMTLLFIILMTILLVVLVIFNWFADRLLNASEKAKRLAESVIVAIESSINYASKIQQNLLPCKSVFENAFSDYSIIWKPRDIVGGDIYWAKNYPDGTVLCVCDCTGHGTPGALLTMLVVSSLESVISEKRYKNTAEIIYKLDQRLATVLNVDKEDNRVMDINDGCDIAVLFISNDGVVSFSAGNIDVFVCDGNDVTRYKGQSLFVGEGRISSPENIKTTVIAQNTNNKFYITSDGTPDQIGGERSKQFGHETFKRIILENHHESQAVISDRIWTAFESFRGKQARRDDIELISFKL